MTQMKAPKSMKACEAMLAEIETELLVAIPQAVRQRHFQEPAYGVLICYLDLTAEKHRPYPTVLWEKHRANCAANREVGDIWFIPEIGSAFPCIMPESETLRQRCELVYDFLTKDLDVDEEQMILPFRKMIYRVSMTLNRLDWSKILPVTDDFVVMATDWNCNWVREDAQHSVPPAKQQRLKEKGFFFNPDDLPEPEVPESNPILGMAQRPVVEQIPYWTEQLESLVLGHDCDATRAKWGPKRILQSLCNLQEPGGDALLSLVEKFADVPEWKDGKPCQSENELRFDSPILCQALDKASVSARSDDATEKRLWALFDRTLKVNKGRDVWGYLPGALAHCIQSMFRAKYDYWVTRNSEHQLLSLDQIVEQRKAKAPT